ncbi:hypothetical protein P389DRAFT_162768 [Cystobasidium minutum MCA 4210]|uniref:uncharacterized protein n=1 Tax=Cystobasidium minutum MCA 4210 TaxID=1397322 RepID=UPI0034CF4F59|eukprot:jgi/Rhomi1/162768/estExt_Genewise1Plus.C_6_t10373
MLPSRALWQTAARASRRSNSRVLAHLLAQEQDLVGPPDPLTNLRPVYYAPRFTTPAPVSSTKKLHPYQLDEFGTSDLPRSSMSLQKTEKLENLRRRFEAEDLEWRLQQRRLDQISHEHWARSNLAFAAAKEEAENRARMSSISPSKNQYDPYIMEEFHRNWVATRGPSFEAYQREWIAGIFGHLKPAMKALYRDWRWKFELWRHGLSKQT